MSATTIEYIAKVLVINEKNEVLVLTVGEYSGRPDKSYAPDLPGGIVDPGETVLDAAVRELYEETKIGVEPTSFELLYTSTGYFPDEQKSVMKFLYLIHLNETPSITLSPEHVAYQWASLRTLSSEVRFRTFCKESIEYCFASKLLSVSDE